MPLDKMMDPDFVKDSVTGVVINTNSGKYTEFKAKRAKIKADRVLLEDVTSLKDQVKYLTARVEELEKKVNG